MLPSGKSPTDPTLPAAPPAGPGPVPNHSRDWLWRAGLGLLLVSPVAFLGIRSAFRAPDAIPPEVSGTHIDREVHAALGAARSEVVGHPSSAKAWGHYGMVLRAHNFEAEADVCFAEAERLDRADGRWPYYRGMFAEFGGSDGIPRGEPHFRRAASLPLLGAEYQSAARLRLAEALYDRSQFEEADALFRDELAVTPVNHRATFGRGLIAIARADEASARTFLAAVQDHPSARQKACTRLAALARRTGDSTSAARFQTAASSYGKDEDWPDPFLRDCSALGVGRRSRLVQIDELITAGRIDEAIQGLQALNRDSNSPLVECKKAALYGRLGNHERAEFHAREGLKLDADSAPAHHLLAATLYLRAKAKWPQESERDAARALFRECIEHFRLSLRNKPDNVDAYRTLGQALFHIGEKDEAIRQLRLAVACRPERYENHMVLGEFLAEVGEKEEALRVLTTAEQLGPPSDPRLRAMLDRLRGSNK